MINRCQATLRRCSGLFAYSGCLGQTGLTCRSWPELTLLAGSCACLLTGLIANTKMRHERTQSRSSANHEQLRLSLFDGKIHCRPVDTLRAPFVDHSASTHTGRSRSYLFSRSLDAHPIAHKLATSASVRKGKHAFMLCAGESKISRARYWRQ